MTGAIKRGNRSPSADFSRIAELREKIGDKAYVDGAVQRLAQVLSSRLVEITETPSDCADGLPEQDIRNSGDF